MRDLMMQFEQVCQDFPEFRALVAKAEATTTDEGMRRQLQALGSKLDENFGQLQDAFPRAVSELERKNAETQQTIEQTQRMVKHPMKNLLPITSPQHRPPCLPFPHRTSTPTLYALPHA